MFSSLDPQNIGQALIESDAFAVCALDASNFRFASQAFRVLLGISPELAVEGLPFETFVLPSERARIRGLLVAPDTLTVNTTFTALRPDHSTVDLRLQGARVRFGGQGLLVAIVTDITAERREREELSALAFVDPLTGLPNRALLLDRLRDTLVTASREHRTFAVFLADLDGFKQVNDTLGHDAGDAVLRLVASRLRAATRTADTVARLGGDELALVLPSAGTEEAAAIVGGRILRSIAEPMSFNGKPMEVGISIGIALYPRDGADVDTLIARADHAMYDSKHAGKGRFTFSHDGAGPTPGRHVFIAWSEEHAFGVSFIDAEHQHIVELAGVIGELLKSGDDEARLAEAFGALKVATVEHFAHEERVMAERHYPGLAAHAREHARLLDDLASLATYRESGSMVLTMRYMSDWLFRHMDTVDRGLARWLLDHDAQAEAARVEG